MGHTLRPHPEWKTAEYASVFRRRTDRFPSLRGAKRRSNPAFLLGSGLLRFARNDEESVGMAAQDESGSLLTRRARLVID
jgi:hypothetical protein